MLKAFIARIKEGCRTGEFPPAEPNLPPDFRGRPEIDAATSAEEVEAMAGAQPFFGFSARFLFCFLFTNHKNRDTPDRSLIKEEKQQTFF